MNKEQISLWKWIKEHKKALILAGLSIAALLTIIICIRNRQTLMIMAQSLRKIIEKAPDKAQAPASLVQEANVSNAVGIGNSAVIDNTLIRRAPHNVGEHIRNLPKGYNASALKISMAAEKGLDLKPGQTFVSSYRTGKVIA